MKYNSFAQVDGEVKKLEKEHSELQKTVVRIEKQIESEDVALSTLWDEYKTKVLSDEKKGISDIEELFEEKKKNLNRLKAMAEGLREKIIVLEKKLAEARDGKKELFSFLAKAWLLREIDKYDELATKTTYTISRLLIAFNYLREMGIAEVYREVLGEGYSFLPGIKLPILKKFDRAIFLDTVRYQVGEEERKKVFDEIVK